MKTGGIAAFTRDALLRLRIHRLDREQALDPSSDEYLYLVLQRKRLSLSTSMGRFRPGTVLLWPLLTLIVAVKTADLMIANQIVRALITERDLMERSRRGGGPAA